MSDDLVVTSDIPFGSAHAYRRGDKHQKDAVEANDWEDYVASPSTKAAVKPRACPKRHPKLGTRLSARCGREGQVSHGHRHH